MSYNRFVYNSDTNDCIWFDEDAFTEYINNTLGEQVPGFEVVKQPSFNHDTAGSYTYVNNVEEWVKENLDMSCCPSVQILTADITKDGRHLEVLIDGDFGDVDELMNESLSIWNYSFSGVDASTAVFILLYDLEDWVKFNPTKDEVEPIREVRLGKVTSKNDLKDAILKATFEITGKNDGFKVGTLGNGKVIVKDEFTNKTAAKIAVAGDRYRIDSIKEVDPSEGFSVEEFKKDLLETLNEFNQVVVE